MIFCWFFEMLICVVCGIVLVMVIESAWRCEFVYCLGLFGFVVVRSLFELVFVFGVEQFMGDGVDVRSGERSLVVLV